MRVILENGKYYFVLEIYIPGPLEDCISDIQILLEGYVNLYNRELGDAGAIELAKYLPYTQIAYLDLGDNNIEAEGGIELAKYLPHTQIIDLNLNNNKIGAEGAIELAKQLAYTKITYLNLSNNEIGDEGAIEIAKYLPATQITDLYLRGNNIGDEGAKELAKHLANTKITNLDLSNNEIEDAGVRELAKQIPNTQITYLNLYNSEIGDEGVIELAKHLPYTQITYFNLSYNNIRDEGSKELAKQLPYTQITALGLSGNRAIGDEGAKELAKQLPHTHILYYNGKTELYHKCDALLKKMLCPSEMSKNDWVEVVNSDTYAMLALAKEKGAVYQKGGIYEKAFAYFYYKCIYLEHLVSIDDQEAQLVYKSLYSKDEFSKYLDNSTSSSYKTSLILSSFKKGCFDGVFTLLHGEKLEESYKIVRSAVEQLVSDPCYEEYQHKGMLKMFLLQVIYAHKNLYPSSSVHKDMCEAVSKCHEMQMVTKHDIKTLYYGDKVFDMAGYLSGTEDPSNLAYYLPEL